MQRPAIADGRVVDETIEMVVARHDLVDGRRRRAQIGDVERRGNAFGMLLAISPARSASRPLIPTTAPAAAMPRAISSPSPRVAPVISTMRPDSEKRSSPEESGGRVIDRRRLDSGQ